jgi:hypothetical protein
MAEQCLRGIATGHAISQGGGEAMTAYRVSFAHNTTPVATFPSPEEARAYVRSQLGPDVRFAGKPTSGELAWVGDPLTPGAEMITVLLVTERP